jgi:hypothetical protein
MRISGNIRSDFLQIREHGGVAKGGVYSYDISQEEDLKLINDDVWAFKKIRKPGHDHENNSIRLVRIYKKEIGYEDVFSSSIATKETYVSRLCSEIPYDLIIETNLKSGGQIIVLNGPSKVGKSAVWKKCIPNNHIEIKCNQQMSVKDIFDCLQESISPKSSLGLTTNQSKQNDGQLQGGAKSLCLRINSKKCVVVLENYHRLETAVFKDFCCGLLKTFSEELVNVLLVGIPRSNSSVATLNTDLEGRVCSFYFDLWGADELRKIAIQGAQALNINISLDTLDLLSLEAAGSPLLMQEYCRILCLVNQIQTRQKTTKDANINDADLRLASNMILKPRIGFFEEVYKDATWIASTIFGIDFDFMKHLSDYLKRFAVIRVPLSELVKFPKSTLDPHKSGVYITKFIEALNQNESTVDLFGFDSTKKDLVLCRPLFLPYIRLLT